MSMLLIVAAGLFTALMLWQTVQMLLSSHEEQMRDELLEQDMRQIEELLGRRELFLNNLRELELDRDLGRLSEEDYEKLRRRYELKTLGVMRKLDQLHGGHGWEERLDAERTRADEAPEAPKASAKPKKKAKKPKQAPTQAAPTTPEEDTEQEDAKTVCHACGVAVSPTAKFCSECGAKLGEQAASRPAASDDKAPSDLSASADSETFLDASEEASAPHVKTPLPRQARVSERSEEVNP